MTDLAYYRDEIIRAALESISNGIPVSAAVSAAVDSAIEFVSLERLNKPGHPLREVLTEHELRETHFQGATRRQPTPTPLPAGKHKGSKWWMRPRQ